MKILPKFTALLLVIFLLVISTGSALAAPKTAKVLPACSGNCLNGSWPDQTGCSSSATTVLSAYIKNGSTNIGLVELRFSSSCNTNWTRVTSYIGTSLLAGEIERNSGPDGGYLCYNNPATPGCLGSDAFNTTTQMFTPQVYAPNNPARATGFIATGGNTYHSCVANPPWSC